MFTRDPGFGFANWATASSAGAGARLTWLSNLNSDLTVAKALAGPRDDTRFFFSVTGKY